MLYRYIRASAYLLILCIFSMRAFPYSNVVTTIPEVTNLDVMSDEPLSEDGSFEINATEIEESPNLDILSLLKQEQSVVRVTNNSGDSSQSSLSLRGFGDNAVANTLILVDGFPLTNPSLLSPNFNSLSLSDIENVKIIQGSRGTLYGDQAVGGVVLITTKHPKKFTGALTAGLGSFNRQYYSAYLGSRFREKYFIKAYHFNNQTNNYRQHQDQSDNISSMTVGWEYASGDLSLSVQRYHDSTEFPGGLTESQYKSNPRQATNSSNHAQYFTHVYQVLQRHQLNDKWFAETHIESRRINSDGFLFSTYQRTEWMNTFAPQLEGQIGDDTLILGYLFQNSDYELTNRLQNNNAHTVQQNIYTELTHPFNSAFTLQIGGRYARQDNYAEEVPGNGVNSKQNAFVSEQSLQYKPSQGWQLYLRRDENFRFPKANEQVWTEDGSGKLKVQTGQSYEAGLSWQYLHNKLAMNLYQLNLDNEIAFDPTQTASQPFGSYRNFSKTERKGVTLSDRIDIHKKLTLQAQINYVNARFAAGAFKGNAIPAVPNLNGSLGLDYQITELLKLSENAIYTGKRYASDDDNNVAGKLPGYWLHSIALQYQYHQIQLSAEINNVFDQRYPAYVFYDSMIDEKTYYPGSGRSYLLTLKADLG